MLARLSSLLDLPPPAYPPLICSPAFFSRQPSPDPAARQYRRRRDKILPGRRLETNPPPLALIHKAGVVADRHPKPDRITPELQPGAYRRGIIEASSPPAGPLLDLPSVSFVERIAFGPARRLRQATVNWRPPRNCPYFTDFDTPTVATRASIIPCLGLHHRCGLIPTRA